MKTTSDSAPQFVPYGTTYSVVPARTNDEPPRTVYDLVCYEEAGTPHQECHRVSTYESWGEAVRAAVNLRRRRVPFEGHYSDPSPEQVAKFFALLAETLPAGSALPPYGYQCLAPLLALARAYLLAVQADQDGGRAAQRVLVLLARLQTEALELQRDATVFSYDKERDADD